MAVVIGGVGRDELLAPPVLHFGDGQCDARRQDAGRLQAPGRPVGQAGPGSGQRTERETRHWTAARTVLAVESQVGR